MLSAAYEARRGRAALLLIVGTWAAGLVERGAWAQSAVAASSAAVLEVPPLPRGGPAELVAFVDDLARRSIPPDVTREEALDFKRGVAVRFVQAGERILADTAPGTRFHGEGVLLKLEGLAVLGRLGDEQAAAALDAFAEQVTKDGDPRLARQAWWLLVDTRSRAAMENDDLDTVLALVGDTARVLAANPDDTDVVELGLRLAQALDTTVGGERRAAEAYRRLAPVLAKSGIPQVRQMAETCRGAERRLELPGKPLEIDGTLLDGTPFDQRSLAGKVMLVDFWATFCAPCLEELPRLRALQAKYRDRGFAVVGVSLDEDPAAVAEFVDQQQLPWPVIVGRGEEAGWNLPLARRYGISGIPQMILVGRDGNVIAVNVTGETLAERLAALFPDER